MIGLWAIYALAVLPRSGPDPTMVAELEKAAAVSRCRRRAGRLAAGRARVPEGEREHRLDEATTWAASPSPAGDEDLAGPGDPRTTAGREG